jgi:hypothetical protein
MLWQSATERDTTEQHNQRRTDFAEFPGCCERCVIPDESVQDWKNCRRPYFSDLICSAIRESGFVDPIVARYRIAAVLAVIETQGPVMERS